MTWVRFSYDEPPAPSLSLPTPGGEKQAIDDFRGRSNLVVLFLHGWSCEDCRGVISRFSASSRSLEAKIIVVVPDAAEAPPRPLEGMTILIDEASSLKHLFAGLLEFDLPGDLLMFVLDSFSVPFRAWVGEKASEIDLLQKAIEALDFIVIQCPE